MSATTSINKLSNQQHHRANKGEGNVSVLFKAGRQLIKVRFMMLLTLACALGSVYWGIDLAQTHGLRPADGGQLAPLSTRLAFGISVAALGCSFAFGMWVYGRCYVSRMEFDERAKKLYVYTLRLFGSRRQEVKLADVLKRTFHRGKANYGDLSVDAPWQSIRVAGRRLPLILDLQGEFPNPKLLERVFGWNR